MVLQMQGIQFQTRRQREHRNSRRKLGDRKYENVEGRGAQTTHAIVAKIVVVSTRRLQQIEELLPPKFRQFCTIHET